MSIRRGILTAIICAVAVSANAAEERISTEKPLTNYEIIQNLNRIAFLSEYSGKWIKHVRKWTTPLKIGIQGNPPPEFENMLSNYLDELIAATNHPMSLVYSSRMRREKRLAKGFNPKKDVNVLLLYQPIDKLGKHLPDKQFPEKVALLNTLRVGKATCMAKIFKKGPEIRLAYVIIPAKHGHPRYGGKILRTCIVEELTQILGLANDSDKVKRSMFVQKNQYSEIGSTKYITPGDRLMLKVFYDPRLKVGMPRQEALQLAFNILNFIRPGGIAPLPEQAQKKPKK